MSSLQNSLGILRVKFVLHGLSARLRCFGTTGKGEAIRGRVKCDSGLLRAFSLLLPAMFSRVFYPGSGPVAPPHTQRSISVWGFLFYWFRLTFKDEVG